MSKKMKVHFSSASNEWATPWDLYNRINEKYGPFDLDPCCTPQNKKCCCGWGAWQDGLIQTWNINLPGTTRVFVNPPYGREIGKWVKKSYEEALKNATVVCLIPSRTDTKWWHEYCMRAAKIIFIKGRLKFERQDGKTGTAPFPSCLVIFGKKDIDKMPWIDTMEA